MQVPLHAKESQYRLPKKICKIFNLLNKFDCAKLSTKSLNNVPNDPDISYQISFQLIAVKGQF